MHRVAATFAVVETLLFSVEAVRTNAIPFRFNQEH